MEEQEEQDRLQAELEAARRPLEKRLKAHLRGREGAELNPEDLAQTVLYRAYASREAFRGQADDPEALMAWLMTIARNRMRDLLRRRREDHQDPELLDVPQSVTSVTEAVRRDERAERVHAALEGLSDVQREVIRLRNEEEATFEEIGRRLDRSAEAARKLYARALVRLGMGVEGLN